MFFLIRPFDLCFSLLAMIITFPFIIFAMLISFYDTKSPFFFQTRIGKKMQPFKLIKFRTMPIETPSLASHLICRSSVSKFGHFLRKTKLDELPQLVNVIKGDMSLVGPRPNLFNQEELIHARDALDVYSVRPGITGLAQIKDIDMSTPELLAKTDAEMIATMSVVNYFKYIFLTVAGKGRGDRLRL
jgi:O-antigen biosynthesis protein WbqP